LSEWFRRIESAALTALTLLVWSSPRQSLPRIEETYRRGSGDPLFGQFHISGAVRKMSLRFSFQGPREAPHIVRRCSKLGRRKLLPVAGPVNIFFCEAVVFLFDFIEGGSILPGYRLVVKNLFSSFPLPVSAVSRLYRGP